LEPQEIRETAVAFAWLIPVPPANVAALAISLALQFTGTAIAPEIIPWLVAMLYSVLALFMFVRHSHTAQRSVARRLGIDAKVARKIDFRGYERFDRSIAAARSAHDAARRDAPH
jgi:membrane protein implicated in regulation of membrane protease activity